jgi:hypothetical protein
MIATAILLLMSWAKTLFACGAKMADTMLDGDVNQALNHTLNHTLTNAIHLL